MRFSQFHELVRTLPEPHVLVTPAGEVVSANRPALGAVGARDLPFSLLPLVTDPAALERYLGMCARSASLLPGALTVRDGSSDPRRYRCEGAVVQPAGEESALILLRIRPQEAASRRFLLLNRKIEELNREIHERRRAEEALYGQTLELEELAAEQEQTLEALQARTEESLAAREAAERAAGRTEILLEAAEILSSSPEYQRALEELAHLATRTIADYCITYLLAEDGSIRRVGASHADPSREPLVRELLHLYPLKPEAEYGASQVLRTGESVLVRDIPDGMLEAAAQDAEHLRILRELAPRSSMLVPLQAHGRMLGALAVATTAGGKRQYEEDDLKLLEDIARRAALAIDTARLLEDAQEANRAKANFLATMSHELRTPLNAIVGYTDLLDTGIDGPLHERQKSKLGRIRASAHHLVTIIEEVLTFSRIEVGKERVRAEPLDARQMLEEAAAMVAPVAASRGLALDVDRPAGPVPLTSDPGRIRQILINLLGNAIKFTDAGSVRLSLVEEDDAVVFQVRDTGIGILKEHRERIFEPFWQVDQHTTRRAGGTGLGLTVTRRLARLLGGDISVESRLDQGTTFSVRVPRVPPEAQQRPAQAGAV